MLANKHAVRCLAAFLLISGVLCIVYPYWDKQVQHRKQLELLTAWDERDQSIRSITGAETAFSKLNDTGERNSRDKSDHVDRKRKDSGQNGEPEMVVDGIPMVGTITIEKLDLLEPILEGTSKETLDIGVGTVVQGRKPGVTGNYALAGHRSWTHGRQFSRLDEVEIGDEIVIETRDDEYVYVVTDTFLVAPDELHVLDQHRHEAQITLITCEPMRNPTHRLIVKAVMQDA